MKIKRVNQLNENSRYSLSTLIDKQIKQLSKMQVELLSLRDIYDIGLAHHVIILKGDNY